MIILLMGVAGSGKTTVGARLAEDLGWPFYDGDAFHPPANVARMAQGRALTDADRAPWLAALRALIDDLVRAGAPAVLTCSALKQAYRDQLLGGQCLGDPDAVRLVYLRGDEALVRARMAQRPDHFFDPALLRSQFDILEAPADALTIDIDQPPEVLVRQIRQALGV